MIVARVLRGTALAAIALAASALTQRAHAQQTGTVRGTVTDSASARGIVGAQVTITGSTRGGLTNDAGEYTIRGVPAGTVTIRAQRIGFAPVDRSVTVTANETVVADFTLASSARALSEVVVVGYGTSSRQNVSSAITSVSA